MIEKIVIKIGDKKIKLTVEEALQLKEDLNAMYGNEYVYYPSWPLSPSVPLYPCDDRWTYTSCGGTS